MPDLPTRLDLLAIGRDYVRRTAQKIDPATIDVEGSDVNLQVGSQSEVSYALVGQLAGQAAALLIDGAEDDELDRVVFDRCNGMTRKGAAAAVGSVTFSRPTAGAGSGVVPVDTKLRSLTGIEFILTSTAVFGASDLTATANVRAVEAGSSGRLGKNTIRSFAQASLLFDTTITVNNDEATAGGEEREEDPEFRERARNFWRTVRRGTLGAIEQGATSVPGVASAEAVEETGSDDEPARVVTLYIADSAGNSNKPMADAVRAALEEWRAGGIAVIISTSVPELVEVELALTFLRSTDTSTIAESIRFAIVSFVNSLPVNGTLFRAELISVLTRFKSDGLQVSEDMIVEPAGDIVPTPGRTLRTRSSLVTTVI